MPEELLAEDLETQEQVELEVPTEETPSEVPPEQEGVEPQPHKMVPLPALQEAREEIRQLRQQVQMANTLRQEFEEYRNRQQYEKQAAAAPKLPKFEDDPIEYLRMKTEAYDHALRNMFQVEQQRQANEQQAGQMQQITQGIMTEVNKFAATVPDYGDAFKYLVDRRTAELATVGVKDPMQVGQYLEQAAWDMAVAAIQNGINPGQAIYEMAKQYGYQTKAGKPDLATVQQGIANASRTISRGGDVVDAEPTIQALLEAEGDDFDKLWNKMFHKQIKR